MPGWQAASLPLARLGDKPAAFKQPSARGPGRRVLGGPRQDNRAVFKACVCSAGSLRRYSSALTRYPSSAFYSQSVQKKNTGQAGYPLSPGAAFLPAPGQRSSTFFCTRTRF